jgi:hypothetical protein
MNGIRLFPRFFIRSGEGDNKLTPLLPIPILNETAKQKF